MNADNSWSTSDGVARLSTSSSLNSSPRHYPSPNGGAIQKRPKMPTSVASPFHSNNASPKLMRSKLTLDVKSRQAPSPLGDRNTNQSEAQSPLSCPMCNFQEDDPLKLQEHVNRKHFDLTSPAFIQQPSQSTTSSSKSFSCPLCTITFSTSSHLEKHVNLDHKDVISPMKDSPAKKPRSRVNGNEAAGAAGRDPNGNGAKECPVCFTKSFKNINDLARHIDSHFNERSTATASSSSSTSRDALLAQQMQYKEREQAKFAEKKNFDQLKAQYGMDGDGNFREQTTTNLQKAVKKGELSVVDYYERQVRKLTHDIAYP